ncbi:redoxin family protein [Ilumatobacter coccineus]|nr:redoxin family protein [Ilumatobacter coccineus]
MDRRRIVAVVSLGLVGAVVLALVATTDDDDAPVRVAAPATDLTSGDVATPVPAADDSAESEVTDAEAATTSPAPADADPTPADPDPATIDPLVPELPDRGPHPPLLEIDGWLQTDITSLDELRGKVVAVQFWTFGCSNCKATIPHMQALYEKYGGDDFEIVGVHAPEFDFEADPDAVAQAALDLGVSWPIALDTEKRSFRSWQTDRRFWPRLFLIDRDGNVRYDKIGEGKYDVIDAAVGALIDEDA